ncbi:eCIS core domain-containing protein [Kribbella sp. NPDC055071]
MRRTRRTEEEFAEPDLGPDPRPEHEDLDPAQARMRELGQLAGNAAVSGAFGAESTVRGEVEGVTGFDLSAATVHRDSTRAASSGVHGLTEGHEVHLAPGVSPGTPYGDHVLAHELGHVVQQSTGRSGDLEADAETVANTRGSGGSGPLEALPAPKQLAVQHFDPRYHRTSVVNGLAGSEFTADEIGLIYAANWERDLSQAHPALGNVILEWKATKLAAHDGHLTDKEITNFHNACQAVLDAAISDPGGLASGQAYGGYKFYEHMDNPAGTDLGNGIAAALGDLDTGGLPPHIFISREYIKETLFNAAKLNHPELARGQTAAAAEGSHKIRAYLDQGAGQAKIGALPSGAVADETAAEVRRSTGGEPGSGPGVTPEALDLIGRASHALEDFWSHSNFVEIAIDEVEYKLNGLTTATFGSTDSTHAIAHKLRGAADEIDAEMPLIDRMAGRSKTDPAPDQVQLGDETPVVHENDQDDRDRAKDQAWEVAKALPGAMYDGAKRGFERGIEQRGLWDPLIGAAKGAAVGGVTSLLGSRRGVQALRSASEFLDEFTQRRQEKAGDRQAHGLLAKDQPGHEDDAFGNLKTIKFEFAHALSVAADREVTAKLKAVINAPDAAAADQLLKQIYETLDKLIANPSDQHPLADVIVAYRERAVTALKAYRASQK